MTRISIRGLVARISWRRELAMADGGSARPARSRKRSGARGRGGSARSWYYPEAQARPSCDGRTMNERGNGGGGQVGVMAVRLRALTLGFGVLVKKGSRGSLAVSFLGRGWESWRVEQEEQRRRDSGSESTRVRFGGVG